jgi:hypothetical protein
MPRRAVGESRKMSKSKTAFSGALSAFPFCLAESRSIHHAPAFMAVANPGNLNKKQLTETDIRTKFITPAIISSNWDLMTQIREEAFFTNGRVIVRGKTVRRGKAKKADYLLDYKPNLPLAVVEAKDNNHSVGDGMQ